MLVGPLSCPTWSELVVSNTLAQSWAQSFRLLSSSFFMRSRPFIFFCHSVRLSSKLAQLMLMTFLKFKHQDLHPFFNSIQFSLQLEKGLSYLIFPPILFDYLTNLLMLQTPIFNPIRSFLFHICRIIV